jgi:protein transport protein SEC23
MLSRIDVQSKVWICPFCSQRNSFSSNYKSISHSNLPPELLPKFTTIEYNLHTVVQIPPIFLFVVDTCMDTSELRALTETIISSLKLLPEYAWVGLITFGTMVSIFFYQITRLD